MRTSISVSSAARSAMHNSTVHGMTPYAPRAHMACTTVAVTGCGHDETFLQLLRQGDIGVAVSEDCGLAWKHVGIALDEPWHLSYPFLFRWEGEMYMMPEASKQVPTLLLYTCWSDVRQAGIAALWLLRNTAVPPGHRLILFHFLQRSKQLLSAAIRKQLAQKSHEQVAQCVCTLSLIRLTP